MELCTGWLTKQGGSVKSWKRRFFVLSGGTGGVRALRYFKSPKDKEKKPVGEIVLTENTKVTITNVVQFELHAEERTYFLISETAEDVERWVNALENVIGGGQTGRLDDSYMLQNHGYLWKQGGILKSWEVRFCVLTARRLCYYKDATMTQPVASINMKDCSEASMTEQTMFMLVEGEKVHYFASDNPEAVDNWVAVLTNAIDFARLSASRSANRPPPPLRNVSRNEVPSQYSIEDAVSDDAQSQLRDRAASNVPLYNARKKKPAQETGDSTAIRQTTNLALDELEEIEVVVQDPEGCEEEVGDAPDPDEEEDTELSAVVDATPQQQPRSQPAPQPAPRPVPAPKPAVANFKAARRESVKIGTIDSVYGMDEAPPMPPTGRLPEPVNQRPVSAKVPFSPIISQKPPIPNKPALFAGNQSGNVGASKFFTHLAAVVPPEPTAASSQPPQPVPAPRRLAPGVASPQDFANPAPKPPRARVPQQTASPPPESADIDSDRGVNTAHNDELNEDPTFSPPPSTSPRSGAISPVARNVAAGKPLAPPKPKAVAELGRSSPAVLPGERARSGSEPAMMRAFSPPIAAASDALSAASLDEFERARSPLSDEEAVSRDASISPTPGSAPRGNKPGLPPKPKVIPPPPTTAH